MSQTTHTQVTREAIREALSSISQEVASRNPITDAMMQRVGLVILSRIKQAFITKSRGGTDEAGDRWAPLSPKTIAYSKTRQRGKGGRTRTEKKRDELPSQALNKRQQERWWNLYRQGLAMFKGDKGSAAKRAWGIIKREGAQTLVEKYGNRKVEILRDTGLLLNSLSPGSSSSDQVFRVGVGDVTIGTTRKGAAAHHNGVLGRLPQRRLWPAPDKWPDGWWQDIYDQVKIACVDIAIQLLSSVK